MFTHGAKSKTCCAQGETGMEATLAQGLEMYDLQNAQIYSEVATDTHCLLAWSADTILLAFRGTATKVNILADLQVRSSPTPKFPLNSKYLPD